MPSSRLPIPFVLVLALVLGLLAPPALADDAPAEAPAEEPAAEEVFELRITGPVPVQEFLTLVKKGMGLPLAWDRRSRGVQGKEISPDLDFRGTRADAFDAVRGLLLTYDLVLVPLGRPPNRIYFVMDARATQAIIRLRPTYVELDDENLAGYEAQDGLYITTLIPVRHLEALQAARNAVNRLVSGQSYGHVVEVPAANAFVVTDFAPKVAAVYRVLKQMDVPAADRGEAARAKEIVFRAIALAHAEAEEVARVLQEHFRIPEPPPPTPSGARALGHPPPPEPVAEELRIDADGRLNQLLVTGRRKDVAQVAAMVETMDRPVPRVRSRVHVVPLAHANASRTAAVLMAMIQRGPGAWRAEEGGGDLPVVVAHAETNTLLLHASDEATEALRRLIESLDRPSPGK